MPPIRPSTQKAVKDNAVSKFFRTFMKGAVSNPILATTIQENVKICRFGAGTNSEVPAMSIDCDIDTPAFGIDESTIQTATRVVSLPGIG